MASNSNNDGEELMIDNSAIAKTLATLVASFCGLEADSLKHDTLIDDIGLDSMSLMQIFAAIEDEYGLEVRDEDVELFMEVHTLGGYADLLNNLLRRREAQVLESAGSTTSAPE
jgi:acyl carrier protein